MNINIIGHRLKIARAMQQPPMSQQALATQCQVAGYNGITKQIISKIERGVRGVSDIELRAFSRVLNVSINWLVKETDDYKRK